MAQQTEGSGRGGSAGRAEAGVARAAEAGGSWAERGWKVVITTGLFAWLWRDELMRLADTWKTAQESHGLLIPLFSAYFVYQQRAALGRTVGRASWLGLAVMVLSLGGYLFFSLKGFAYPRQMMMIIMLGGVVLLLGGRPIFRLTWLPVAFLVFAIPLPQYMYDSATSPLQRLASQVGAMVLNALPGVNCEVLGVTIHGTQGREPFSLEVAEACSGMRLLRAFVALGVAMAYLERRPWVHRVVLVLSTVPIAVLCNVVRVVLTGLIHLYLGPEAAQGTLHALLGIGMLVLAFGLYGLLAWVMNRLFVAEETESAGVLVVGRKGDAR